MKDRNVEILAPAGSVECLKAAVCAGADAIYLGGTRFGARAYADNLDEKQLLEAIDYVHLHGKRIYMTINTLFKEQELDELYAYLRPYYEQGLDAVIVQDVGAMQLVRDRFPDIALHVSTQATVTNSLGASFFKKIGAERIVPARELSLKEIRKMKQDTGLEIECFVHGAMCYCYSGQCLMSSMIGGRSGNRGQCAQPCRLPYGVGGKKAADIMSLKDMCAIELIPELTEAGIDSFKIEGRMKQPDYVYTVTEMYRRYADLYLEKGDAGFHVKSEDLRKLEDVYRRRGYCDGYYHRQNGKEMISLKRPPVEKEKEIKQIEYKIQEKINGKLILSEGECARLSLKCVTSDAKKEEDLRNVQTEVIGEVVLTAKNQPLSEERIEKQIRKTGNTEFEIQNLDIELNGNVFLPMQALNELRREAISGLEQNILQSYRRVAAESKHSMSLVNHVDIAEKVESTECTKEQVDDENCADENKQKRTCSDIDLQVYIHTIEQLQCAIERDDIRAIYIDDQIAFEHSVDGLRRSVSGKNCELYVAMPYIFRQRVIDDYEKKYADLMEKYDGVLIRNWESLQWLMEKGYQKRIISDYPIYVFNSESKKFLRQAGIDDYTSQPELNQQELKRLSPGGVLIAYGYQPVMITANCIRRTTSGCTGEEGNLFITDRRGKNLLVKNICRHCYNVIYNSVPLVLTDLQKEISQLCPTAVRLDFVQESGKEMSRILDSGELPKDYTRGHFKRGVK